MTTGASQVLQLFTITPILFIILLISKPLVKKHPRLGKFLNGNVVSMVCGVFGIYFFLYAVTQFYGSYVTESQEGIGLILMRTLGAQSSHLIAYGFIMVFSCFTFFYPKINPIRCGIMTLGVLGYHELLWNIFYLPTCVQFNGTNTCSWQILLSHNGLNVYMVATITFSMYLIGALYFYPKEFKASLKQLPFWVGFMVLWLIAGFHISIDSRLNPATLSVWYPNPDVGLVENLSWYIFCYMMLKAYLEVHPFKESNAYKIWSFVRSLDAHKGKGNQTDCTSKGTERKQAVTDGG